MLENSRVFRRLTCFLDSSRNNAPRPSPNANLQQNDPHPTPQSSPETQYNKEKEIEERERETEIFFGNIENLHSDPNTSKPTRKTLTRLSTFTQRRSTSSWSSYLPLEMEFKIRFVRNEIRLSRRPRTTREANREEREEKGWKKTLETLW